MYIGIDEWVDLEELLFCNEGKDAVYVPGEVEGPRWFAGVEVLVSTELRC